MVSPHVDLLWQGIAPDPIQIAKKLNIQLTQNEIGFYQQYQSSAVIPKDTSHIYGEICRSGVYQIFEYISKNCGSIKTIYDIGSGIGRLSIHLALLVECQVIGVEIDKLRHLWSKHLQQSIGVGNLEFIRADIRDIDISKADLIISNDVVFDRNLVDQITEKIPNGCHIISFEENGLGLINHLELAVSWMEVPIPFRHTQKK